jgi:glycosyltransferase involved in cell wall biosynthesis
MIHVLVTGMTTNRGGVESLVFNYVSRLAEFIQFDFWCNNDRCAFERELTDLGCRVFHGTAYGKNYLQAHHDAETFFRERAQYYNALWSNKSMLVNIDDLRLARQYGISRIILHSHNSQDMYSGVSGLVKSTLHRINRFTANRIATDYWACSRCAGQYFFTNEHLHGDEYLFVPNAIDAKKFTYSSQTRTRKRSELGIPADTTVVGFVGRLQYQKDPEFLMQIFVAFHELQKNSILLIVGSGELEEQCKRIICDAGLDGFVTFLGNRNDTAELYQAMDVFCLPSRFEGLPVVLLEAQATGLPSLVSAKITPEAVATNLVTFESKKSSPHIWAYEMLQLLVQNPSRRSPTEQIRDAGFDIDKAVGSLQTF